MSTLNEKPAAQHSGLPGSRESSSETDSGNANASDDLELGPKDSTLPSEKLDTTAQEPKDPNVVDWDGPDDPANPLNWSSAMRVGHIALVGVITLLVNLASTMFAPAAALLMKDFHSESTTIGTLTVSLYVLGFALGPLVIAPLSELYGRLVIYHVCNGVFLAFTIGCALSTNLGMFLPFRFFAGCAGSAPLTIGGGTIADVTSQEKRGPAMAIFAVGPLIGPIVGPIIGGFVGQDIGWRWTFWIIAIMSGVVSIIALVVMRETYPVVLLNRKAARLRKETGRSELVSRTDLKLKPRDLFVRSIVRPMKLLFLSQIVLALSTFCAFVFGLTFLLYTTFPAVFEEQYGFSSGVSGLAYLGLGIGMFVGLVLFSASTDKVMKKKAGDGEMKPEYRLAAMTYVMPIIPIGFFWYGWSAYSKVHWIVPILGTSLIGFGVLFVIIPAQIYSIDAFGPYAASALAANTVLRSLFGAFLPLAGPKMYQSLGLGWGNTLLGFLALSFCPIAWFLYKYGERLRKRRVLKL